MAESRFDAAPGEAKRPSDEALPLENELMLSAGNAGSAGAPEMLPDNLLAGGAESASSLSSSPADEAYVGSPDAGGEDAVPESAWQRVSKWTPLQNVLGLLALLISFGAYYLSRELEDTDSLSSTFDFARETASRVGIYIVGGLAIAIVLTLIWGWANWRARSFALTDRGIHIRSGILFKRHNQLRWDRVQAVDIKRSIIARLVGQGTVEVSPGGMQLSAVSIGLLPVETCEKLRAYILDVAARVRAGGKAGDRELAGTGDHRGGSAGNLPARHWPVGGVQRAQRQILYRITWPGLHVSPHFLGRDASLLGAGATLARRALRRFQRAR